MDKRMFMLSVAMSALMLLTGCPKDATLAPVNPAASRPATTQPTAVIVREREESPTEKDLLAFIDRATASANAKAHDLDGKVFVQDVEYAKSIIFDPADSRTQGSSVTKSFKVRHAVAQSYAYQYQIDQVGPIVTDADKFQRATVRIKVTVKHRTGEAVDEKLPDVPPGMKARALMPLASMPSDMNVVRVPAIRTLPEIPAPAGASFEVKTPLAAKALAAMKSSASQDKTFTLVGSAKYYPQRKAWYLFVATTNMAKPVDLSDKVK